MQISFTISQQTRPSLQIPTTNHNHLFRHVTPKEKVVVVMGATGAGKSRLSVDLAAKFEAEIVNSDKMQVYHGLDITTNKITDEEQKFIPHHLLGIAHPDSEFSAGNFRALASQSIKSIIRRGSLPIIVGGSNSYLEALIDANFRSQYDLCYLWVDAKTPVLHQFVSDRVDKMIDNGMVDELRDFFRPNGDYSTGIRRAIGVSEFDEFFRIESNCDEERRARVLSDAIDAIKMNTRRLARRQLEKINRLRVMKGWNVHRIDATDVLRRRGGEAADVVARRGAAVVSDFLRGLDPAVVCGGATEVRARDSLMAMV